MSDRPVPRVALTRGEAAESLGVSLSFFKERIQPELRVIRLGSVRLFPIADLERWAAERARRVEDDLESQGAKSPREAGTSGGRRRAKKIESRRREEPNDG